MLGENTLYIVPSKKLTIKIKRIVDRRVIMTVIGGTAWLIFAGIILWMADGPTLQLKSSERHGLPALCWKVHRLDSFTIVA